MVDVLVVGLGIMGAWCCDALAGAGHTVLGLEAGELGIPAGSSAGDTRVIRTAYYEHPDYVGSLRRAWAAWQRLEAEAGEPLLVPCGVLHVGRPDAAELLATRQSAAQHGVALEELGADEGAARFPWFRWSPELVALFEPQAGALLAERAHAAVLRRARGRGARLRGRARVERLEPRGDEVAALVDGEEIVARRVVWTAGPWLAAGAWGLTPPPLEIVRQVQLWFGPRAGREARSLRWPSFVCFDEGRCLYGIGEWSRPGVKVCEHGRGSPARPDALDRVVEAADVEPVAAFVRDRLPALDPRPWAASVCMYALTGDRHFVIGPVDGSAGRVIVAGGFSGHGFKLAPEVGALVAGLVRGERAVEPLFDPQRFGRGGS